MIWEWACEGPLRGERGGGGGGGGSGGGGATKYPIAVIYYLMIETTFIQNLSYFANNGLFSTQTQMLMYLKHKQRMRMLLVFAYSIDENFLTKTLVNLVKWSWVTAKFSIKK